MISPPVRYALINERLCQTAPNGDIVADVTKENFGKNIDPQILASVLRNLGKEMTLNNWAYRMAYFLSERLDIRLRGDYGNISSDIERESKYPCKAGIRDQEGSLRPTSNTPDRRAVDTGVDSGSAQDIQSSDKTREPDKTNSETTKGDDIS